MLRRARGDGGYPSVFFQRTEINVWLSESRALGLRGPRPGSTSRVTGISPLRFLRQLRLEQARSLLLAGSTVGQAASQVGYSSVSHLIEEFKRDHGQTPRSYTRQLTQLQA